MNHLAHFKVAHPEPGLLVGGFLGDFVKGRLKGEYPDAIERGIRLHRAVDAFSDAHPVTRQSVSRFTPRLRRFAPIVVDVIYDHFLASLWQSYHPENLHAFCDTVFAALEDSRDLMPDRAQVVAHRMMASRSMAKYHRDDFVAGALENLARRIRRDNPIAEGYTEFLQQRDALCEDFTVFFPELLQFCARWQQEN